MCVYRMAGQAVENNERADAEEDELEGANSIVSSVPAPFLSPLHAQLLRCLALGPI